MNIVVAMQVSSIETFCDGEEGVSFLIFFNFFFTRRFFLVIKQIPAVPISLRLN